MLENSCRSLKLMGSQGVFKLCYHVWIDVRFRVNARDRVCIKIPATAESIVACQFLENAGIRTLATCLFSVPQALAASQAGCLYVAPYFNGKLVGGHTQGCISYLALELRVHFEPNLWKKYEDTASEHPTSHVVKEIVASFRSIGSRTLVMPARCAYSLAYMFSSNEFDQHCNTRRSEFVMRTCVLRRLRLTIADRLSPSSL